MPRWSSLCATLVASFFVLSGGQSVCAASADDDRTERPPNIIFILVDDLGYGDLGSYGQEILQTPNLDQMAREGMRFTQVYSGAAVCAPSRSALMTGQHTGHTRIRDNRSRSLDGPTHPPLEAGDVVLPELLQGAGYTTGMFGKWGLGHEGTTGAPGEKGFDAFFGGLDQKRVHSHYLPWLWKNETKVEYPDNHFSHGSDYNNDLFVEEAFSFIEKNKDDPFFLYLPLTVPHADLTVPAEDMEPYIGKFPETPYTFDHYAKQEHPKAAFAGIVTRIDRYVGDLFKLLSDLNLDENTIVFFTSDNGPSPEGGHDPEFFNSSGPFRGGKGELWEGGIRVPMIVRWPGTVPEGAVNDHVWTFWDVLPTLADLTKTQTPEDIDGVSVLDTLLDEDQADEPRFLYWERNELRAFIQAGRRGDWKIIRFGTEQPIELYNLKDDPGETKNVAADYPEIAAELTELMENARTTSPYYPTLTGDELILQVDRLCSGCLPHFVLKWARL